MPIRSLPLLIVVLASALPPGAAGAEDPVDALRSLGLEPVADNNRRWELAEEPLLRRRLETLQQRQEDIAERRRQLAAVVRDNAARWSQIGLQVAAAEKKLKSLPTDHKDRGKLKQQLAQLRQQAVPPHELCAAPRVAALLKQQIDWELDASAKLLWCREALRRVRREHRRLAGDLEVRRRLRQLDAELAAPARYRDADQQLDAAERLVQRRLVPVYREAAQWRVGALIDDRWPVTISWRPEGDLLLLPASLADTLQAQRDPQRSARQVEVAKSRSVLAKPVLLRGLRLGGLSLSNVEAWSLPPEAEDIGARLGQHATAARLRFRPELLHAELSAD